ncbi:MAG: hypothetical protein JXM70_02575 [Pirellulales bacterium]|nr:hypothetical protein [Pirellulales bacterium]
MSRVRKRWLVVALVCVGIALYFGFRNPPLPAGSEWTCPRMLEIKQEWDSLEGIETKTKDEYQDKLFALDDTEFVNNAMQWYEKEKDNLVVNKIYWHNTAMFAPEHYEQRPKSSKQWESFREPLFIKE